MKRAFAKLTVFVTLVGILVVMLTGAHFLPDPCLANPDHCCSETSSPDECGTVCCRGFLVTPETPYVLNAVINLESSLVPIVVDHEVISPEPLIRPPISA
jgi:hypothetical protein